MSISSDFLLKLVNIWWRYGRKFGGTFYGWRCRIILCCFRFSLLRRRDRLRVG